MQSTFGHNHLSRRSFLKISSVTAATTGLCIAPTGQLSYAGALTKEQREKLTADEIIALMKKGN